MTSRVPDPDSRLMYACSISEAGVADFCFASGCEGTHAT